MLAEHDSTLPRVGQSAWTCRAHPARVSNLRHPCWGVTCVHRDRAGASLALVGQRDTP